MTAATALLSQWTAHLRDERRFSDNSVAAYERDVAAFLGFLSGHLGGEPAAKIWLSWSRAICVPISRIRRQGPDAH
jgi:site-specific recombinase XerC